MTTEFLGNRDMEIWKWTSHTLSPIPIISATHI